jgi:hypothetical protein
MAYAKLVRLSDRLQLAIFLQDRTDSKNQRLAQEVRDRLDQMRTCLVYAARAEQRCWGALDAFLAGPRTPRDQIRWQRVKGRATQLVVLYGEAFYYLGDRTITAAGAIKGFRRFDKKTELVRIGVYLVRNRLIHHPGDESLMRSFRVDKRVGLQIFRIMDDGHRKHRDAGLWPNAAQFVEVLGARLQARLGDET